MSRPQIDRASAEDVVALVTDVGSVPMQVGAVLILDDRAAFDEERAITLVGERILTVPRLRQRLVHTPVGCGRPVWVDDRHFDLRDHVSSLPCPAPGDEAALLAVAADVVGTRLPADQPLWRLTIVTGLERDGTAMIFAFHHVLADGIGGLAVLANLVDGVASASPSGFPHPAPATRALAGDSARSWLRSLAELPATVGRAGRAIGHVRRTRIARLERSSLNRSTGRRRQFAVVRADLDDVRRLAHEHGATINDVVLAAVASALHGLLLARGESLHDVVVSVPVSARRHATATELGNQVGVVPIRLPTTGTIDDRLVVIAARTRAAKDESLPATTALLGPAFRLLVRLGVFRWFIDRQRLVHTFVTNVRGPDGELTFDGARITDVVPLAVVTGNVTVSFAALSYAGHLDVTLIADPETCPDLDRLRDALQSELDPTNTARIRRLGTFGTTRPIRRRTQWNGRDVVLAPIEENP